MKKPTKDYPEIKDLERGAFYLLETPTRPTFNRPNDAPDYYLLLKLTHFYQSGVRFAILGAACKEDYHSSYGLPKNLLKRKKLLKAHRKGRVQFGYKTIHYTSSFLKKLKQVPFRGLSLYMGGYTSIHMEEVLKKGKK